VLATEPLGGDTGALAAIVVAGVAAAALGAAVLAPIVREPSGRVDLPAGAIRFGVLQAAGAALTQTAQRGGVLAIVLLGGTSDEAGYAALALGIALGMTYAVLQMFTVSLPHLASAAHGDADVAPTDTARAEVALHRLARTALMVLAPAAVVSALLLDAAVPAVFGAEYGDAAVAFPPAIALVVLAPITSLAVQVSALRTRPEAALAAGIAALAAFTVTAAVAVPAAGAAGATGAALAGVAASTLTSMRMLPGAIRPRLATAAFAAASATLLVGWLA